MANTTVRALIEKKHKEAARIVLPSVRQLAVPDDTGDGLLPAGSAVLIRYRGVTFLVTAAHVVNLYADCSYYVGTGSTWLDIGRAFTMPKRPSDQDLYDFAFYRIPDDTVPKLDACQAVPISQMLIDDSPRYDPPYRSKYLCLGYPLNRFEIDKRNKTTHPKSLSYLATIASPEQHVTAKRDPRSHLVMDYKSRAVVGPKGVQRSPKIVGLSGGGIFTFGMNADRTIDHPRLVGITIEQIPEQRVLIGFRLPVLLAAMDSALRDAI